ncbi:MAG TPA: leucyl aminopeptidase [Bryobacteraceae bacterium]|nr:leucyl aminopeptidase [Bryobacteraceae bacterium]
MKLKLAGPDRSSLECDALILFEFEGAARTDLPAATGAFRESGEITGKFLEFTLLHDLAGFQSRRVLLAGAGKRDKLETATFWKVAAAAARHLKGKGVRTLGIALESGFDSAEYVSAAAQAVIEGVWEPDQLKTSSDKDGSRTIDELTISAGGDASALQAALAAGQAIGEAANLTRDISVEPPNVLTPRALADRARAMAEANGLACDVLDTDRMRQLGMGALLGVAQGSAEPGALIVIEYKPEKPAKEAASAKLALIGKGVTFDTGGISIKPAQDMEKMKYDMCGAAAVIGAMQAIARLKPPVAVMGVVPTVENMPGGKAQRPGDIVKSLSGKTIEILNTDAEGRLILADAITYAKQLGATHMVDAATLTGAIVVALGHHFTGVFTNNDEFLARWDDAAKKSGEKMWHMPVNDQYREQLKTVYADVGNIGGRDGGACTAAAFLREFVEDTPWIHLDIAGTAWLDDSKPWMPKGPTAIPIATFVQLAQDWK